jgi:hypothetical protein
VVFVAIGPSAAPGVTAFVGPADRASEFSPADPGQDGPVDGDLLLFVVAIHMESP